jgi:hypothetical protein
MKTITRFAATSAAVLGALLCSSHADAADSTRGPWYVQVSPVGVAYLNTCQSGLLFYQGPVGSSQTGCGPGLAYRVDVEAGYHFNHRGDGFTVGLRQAFYFAGAFTTNVPAAYDQNDYPRGGSGGISQARLGYDIAVPIKDFELTLAPYVVAGATYSFEGRTNPAAALGVGLDVRFFFTKVVYMFLRPGEVGGFILGGVTYQGGAGVGFGF